MTRKRYSIGLSLMILAVMMSLAPAAVAASIHLSAQDGTEEPPAETTPPEAPTPPETPEGPGDTETEDSGLDTSGVVLLVLVVGALGFVFLAGRGSGKGSSISVSTAPQVPTPPQSEDPRLARLRRSYADARMVLDRLDSQEVDRRRSGSTTHEVAEMRRRVGAVFTDLASLEADAPTALERSTLRETADAVSALDRAVDEAAAASSTDSVQTSLDPARGRVERALDRLGDQIRAGR